jgi:hypothetical protein
MLDKTQQAKLVSLVDFEIKNFLCTTVPKYQSFNNMHVKHFDSLELQIVIKNVELCAYALTNQLVRVDTCWFNVCEEDSTYQYHHHNTLAAVYYLKGCDNQGTLCLKENLESSLPGKDNTIQFIGAGVVHSIPKWAGTKRYSIAFDLRTKNEDAHRSP